MDESQLEVAMRAFRRAVAFAGGQAPFERLTGLKQQTVSYRLRNDIPLKSAEEVLNVEAATGVSRHDLRPDIYPRNESFGQRAPEWPKEAPADGSPPHPAAGAPTNRAERSPSRDPLEGLRS